jgi:hypothetical protein
MHRNPAYREALRDAANEALEGTMRRLSAGSGDAVDLLIGIVAGDANATPAQQRAAAVLLNAALRYTETVSLQREIDELRARVGVD